MLVTTILGLIASILSIVADNVRRKYIDKYQELKKSWYNEYNKPREVRNNAALDTIEFEILTLAKTIQDDLELAK